MRVQGRFPAVHRQCTGMMRTRGKFQHVIARSEATWQSASPAAAQAKRNYSRRIRRSCGFALGITNLPSFSAGKRIAAPVCALVRNDMQKTGACQRMQVGGHEEKCVDGSGFTWYNVLAYADTQQVSACHCEERSDVAIRTPCSSTKRKAILKANTESVTDLPEVAQTCQVFLRGNGLPHQCAHWFAMTCRRRVRVSECKSVGTRKNA